MSETIPPTILIIVGITGDLAERKLLPALEALRTRKLLPKQFQIIGTSRKRAEAAREGIHYIQCDPSDPSSYQNLEQGIKEIDTQWGTRARILIYLSVPPEAALATIAQLGALTIAPRTTLLLEKPFGTSFESAKILLEDIHRYFPSTQIYRVDHYLAKRVAREIREFKDASWSNQTIDRIDIIASEAIGIEGRAVFYEQTGALRDLVQSHLLQFAALVLADEDSASGRYHALQGLVLDPNAKRGQYETYRDEVQNQLSTTETFSSLTLHSNNPRWAGVPITITTGKKLDRKLTEVHIHFKEGTSIVAGMTPDNSDVLEDYEKILFDAMAGDTTLFVTDQEVLEAWRILAPIQAKWQEGDKDLFVYPNGSSIEEVLTKS